MTELEEIDNLLLAFREKGTVRISSFVDRTWFAAIELIDPNGGMHFEIKSEMDHKLPSDALTELANRLAEYEIRNA